jgi:creatinine amidohydrolase/Fe(II)-dependent formamide hydrolase-like protein
MSRHAQEATGYDHAGKWEVSLLSAVEPFAVNLELLNQSDEWFIQSAKEASPETGAKMLEVSIEDLLKRIK